MEYLKYFEVKIRAEWGKSEKRSSRNYLVQAPSEGLAVDAALAVCQDGWTVKCPVSPVFDACKLSSIESICLWASENSIAAGEAKQFFVTFTDGETPFTYCIESETILEMVKQCEADKTVDKYEITGISKKKFHGLYFWDAAYFTERIDAFKEKQRIEKEGLFA